MKTVSPLFMNRFRKSLLALSVMIILLFNACSPAVSISKDGPTLAKEITIYGWEGYMPQSILDAFTAEYGVTIRYLIYGDPIEATAAIRRGEEIDVVVLDNVEVQNAAHDNLLVELDHRALSNFDYIGDDFRDLAFDPNNHYSIPFEWGTSGLLYRADLVEQPPTRWADLWNPAFTGKIGLWPYSQDVIGLTLKSLGYSYNSEDPAELDQAADCLLEIADRVILLDPLSASGVPTLISGETQIIFGWAYDTNVANQGNAPEDVAAAIKYIIPEEGAIIWMDNLAISATSPNPYTAHLFLDFILRPEIAAQIANEMYISIPNEEAHQYIEPEVLNNPFIFPTQDDLVGAEFYAPISPDAQTIYDEIWTRFTNAIPKTKP